MITGQTIRADHLRALQALTPEQLASLNSPERMARDERLLRLLEKLTERQTEGREGGGE